MKILGEFIIYYVGFLLGLCIFLKSFLQLDDINFQNENKSTKRAFYGSDRALDPKIVFILIDAMKYDMLLSKNYFPNLHKYNFLSFKSIAHSPTITLPRIKALTSGAVPNFSDFLLNTHSKALKHDNLVYQWNLHNKSVHFYGDDTWLKLFPNQFKRSDGTVSFFASDFHEVDNNVTRHITSSMNDINSWDILILHYLGLDHIGHMHGPFNSFIAPKLHEMDNVINTIHKGLLTNCKSEWFMFISSDHGMSDSGGHGGSSPNELITPLLIFSSRNITRVSSGSIYQVDVTPLLATLSGVSIPYGSIGKIPHNSYSLFKNAKNFIDSLYANVLQMQNHHNDDDFAINEQIHDLYKTLYTDCYDIIIKESHSISNVTCMEQARKLIKNMEYFLEMKQKHLLQLTKQFDLSSLFLSVVIVNLVLFASIFDLLYPTLESIGIGVQILFGFLLTLTVLVDFGGMKVQLKYALIVIFFVFLLLRKVKANVQVLRHSRHEIFTHLHVANFLSCAFFCYGIFLLSSSFVEEEHQLWYSLCVLSDLFLIVSAIRWNLWNKSIGLGAVVVLVCEKLLRCINQTGDKWSALPDLCDLFVKHEALFCILFFISVLCILSRTASRSLLSNCVQLCIALLSIIARISSEQLPTFYFISQSFNAVICLRLAFLLLCLNVVILRFGSRQTAWYSCLAITLAYSNLLIVRRCNVLVWCLALVKLHYLKQLFRLSRVSSVLITLLYFTHGMAMFFSLGNSNGISTIDVSVGFLAQESYNFFYAGLLISLNTYGGYLFWLLQSLDDNKSALSSFRVVFCFVTIPISIFLVNCVFLRHHLFIWTVFVPKLMYFTAFYLFLGLYFIFCLFQ